MGYHDQAYTPIGAANVNLGHAAVWSDLSADILGIGSNKGLYNGNIAHMLVGVPQLERQAAGAGFAAYAYQYDQLHRIIQSQDYGLNPLSNGWTALATANSNYTYDPNGNILSLSRVAPVGGLPTLIDKLTYNYNRNANGDLLNNKLNYIADNQGVTHANIGDLGSQNANNYTYDAIGQLTQDAAEGITNVVWNIQAKVERVDFGNGKPTVYYTYDAQGNRLTKKVNNATTYYIRDAQGNILATYEQNIADIVLAEQHLYGSARLGLRKPNILVKNAGGLINPDANRRVYTRLVGQKSYEQTNHLGDVVVALSDKVLLQGADYQAIVRNAGLSYPFGWEIPERSYTSAAGGYRFGFNGVEKSPELGEGHNTTFYREQDTRVARWWSFDPRPNPSVSPYAMMENNPIAFSDVLGDTIKFFGYDGRAAYNALIADLNAMANNPELPESQRNEAIIALAEIEILHSSTVTYKIKMYKPKDWEDKTSGGELELDIKDKNFNSIFVNVYYTHGMAWESHPEKCISRLSHELKHAYQYEEGKLSFVYNIIKKKWAPNLYDVGDEREAYARQFILGYLTRKKGQTMITDKDVLEKGYFDYNNPELTKEKLRNADLCTPASKFSREVNRALFQYENCKQIENNEAPKHIYKGWQEDARDHE